MRIPRVFLIKTGTGIYCIFLISAIYMKSLFLPPCPRMALTPKKEK